MCTLNRRFYESLVAGINTIIQFLNLEAKCHGLHVACLFISHEISSVYLAGQDESHTGWKTSCDSHSLLNGAEDSHFLYLNYSGAFDCNF